MKYTDAVQLRYKITLPMIFLLALMAIYLFHTVIIERKHYSDTKEILLNLKLTANEIVFSKNKVTSDSATNNFQVIFNTLKSFPETNSLSEQLKSDSSGLFETAQEFLNAIETGDQNLLTKAYENMSTSIAMASADIGKISDQRTGKHIKYVYAVLFLICIIAALHFFLIDSPMKQEMLRCAREKEVSKSTIKKLTERDTLTNLPGRVKFYEECEKEVSAATRYGTNLALIKIDIHDFKTLNQKHGQKTGDKILAGFARVVRKNLRRPDSFYRVGGDKFIILAPHTSVINAKNLTTKINKLIKNSKSLTEVPFMVNTGIAMCGHKESTESLLKKLDLALSESKKYGPGTVYTQPESVKPVE